MKWGIILMGIVMIIGTVNALNITMTEPKNATYNTTILWLNFTTTTESNETIDRCWYGINDVNTSIVCSNQTINFGESGFKKFFLVIQKNLTNINENRSVVEESGKAIPYAMIVNSSSYYSGMTKIAEFDNRNKTTNGNYDDYSNLSMVSGTSRIIYTFLNYTINDEDISSNITAYDMRIRVWANTSANNLAKWSPICIWNKNAWECDSSGTIIDGDGGNTFKLGMENKTIRYKKTIFSNKTEFVSGNQMRVLVMFVCSGSIGTYEVRLHEIQIVPVRTSTGNTTSSRTEVNLTINSWINITFDKKQNATLQIPGGTTEYFENITEIYKVATDYPNGPTTVSFNNGQQSIAFYNEGQNFFRNATVMDTTTSFFLWTITNNSISVPFYFSSDDVSNNILTEAYVTKNDGKLYLVGSGISGDNGQSTLRLVAYNNYQIKISKTGYYPINDTKYLWIDGDPQRYKLTKIDTPSVIAGCYSNCNSIILTSTTCTMTVKSTGGNMDTVNITGTLDGVGSFSNQWTNKSSVTSTVSVNPTYTNWTLYCYVNGVLLGAQNIRYWPEYLTNRTAQVEVDFGGADSADRTILLMLALSVSAIIAVIANKIAVGSGIYAFGAMTGIIGSASGAFDAGMGALYVCATVVGMGLAIEILKRTLK